MFRGKPSLLFWQNVDNVRIRGVIVDWVTKRMTLQYYDGTKIKEVTIAGDSTPIPPMGPKIRVAAKANHLRLVKS